MAHSEHSVDAEIEAFFNKKSATRTASDARARELAGDNGIPVEVQGVCSYSVYAGPELEYVIQFCPGSLALKTEITSLETKIYGPLAPKVSFKGKIGNGAKESLFVYLMSRVRGVTHLDFVLAHGYPGNSLDNQSWRKNLIGDVAQ